MGDWNGKLDKQVLANFRELGQRYILAICRKKAYVNEKFCILLSWFVKEKSYRKIVKIVLFSLTYTYKYVLSYFSYEINTSMYTYAYNFVFAAATDVNPGLPAPVFGIGVEKERIYIGLFPFCPVESYHYHIEL